MKRIDTDLPGVAILEPRVFGDERGYFYESFNAAAFAELGIDPGLVSQAGKQGRLFGPIVATGRRKVGRGGCEDTQCSLSCRA